MAFLLGRSAGAAAILLAGSAMAALHSGHAAGVKEMSVDEIEARHAGPIDGAELIKTVKNRCVIFTRLSTGKHDYVFYGAQRIDAEGHVGDYEIGDSGIIEQIGDQERAVSFYKYNGLGYACVDLKCSYVFAVRPVGRARANSVDAKSVQEGCKQ